MRARHVFMHYIRVSVTNTRKQLLALLIKDRAETSIQEITSTSAYTLWTQVSTSVEAKG